MYGRGRCEIIFFLHLFALLISAPAVAIEPCDKVVAKALKALSQSSLNNLESKFELPTALKNGEQDVILNYIGQKVRDPDGLIQTLHFNPAEIVEIVRPLGNPGREGAVYEVKTRSGKIVALKVYADDFLPMQNRAVNCFLQGTLSSWGIAPKIYGMLGPDDLHRVRLTGSDNPLLLGKAAVVMEKFDPSWILKSRLSYENGDELLQVLEHFSEVLSFLRIFPTDFDMMVTKDRKFLMFDTDRYSWVSKQNENFGYLSLGKIGDRGASAFQKQSLFDYLTHVYQRAIAR